MLGQIIGTGAQFYMNYIDYWTCGRRSTHFMLCFQEALQVGIIDTIYTDRTWGWRGWMGCPKSQAAVNLGLADSRTHQFSPYLWWVFLGSLLWLAWVWPGGAPYVLPTQNWHKTKYYTVGFFEGLLRVLHPSSGCPPRLKLTLKQFLLLCPQVVVRLGSFLSLAPHVQSSSRPCWACLYSTLSAWQHCPQWAYYRSLLWPPCPDFVPTVEWNGPFKIADQMMSHSQNSARASHLTVKIQVLFMSWDPAVSAPHPLLSLHALQSLPLTFSIPATLASFLFFQPSAQGLYTCCLLCLESVSPETHWTHASPALSFCLNFAFSVKFSPTILYKTASSLPAPLSSILWIIFSMAPITTRHSMYLCF